MVPVTTLATQLWVSGVEAPRNILPKGDDVHE